jgi:hypothetical protein
MHMFLVIFWGTEANFGLHLPSFSLVHSDRHLFHCFTNITSFTFNRLLIVKLLIQLVLLHVDIWLEIQLGCSCRVFNKIIV